MSALPSSAADRRDVSLSSQTRPDVVTVAAIAVTAVALAWMTLAIAHAATTGDADFFVLRESAQLHAMGQSPYGRMVDSIVVPEGTHGNLNHPLVVALLIPFTWVPGSVAFAVWTVVSVIAGLLTVVLIARELEVRWTPRSRMIAGAMFVTFPGVGACLDMGQIGLFLSLAVTVVWLLVRRHRWIAAGLLLGVLVAVKLFFLPLLAVLLVRRKLRALLAAAAGAAGASVVVLPITGLDGFAQWRTALSGVTWFDHALNTSLPGLVSRITGGDLAGPALYAVTAATVVAGGFVLLTRPPTWLRRDDRDFVILLVVCLLASPLGWIYYLPILAPVALVLHAAGQRFTAAGRVWLAATAALLWVPYMLLPDLPSSGVAAAWSGLHTYGMLGIAFLLAGLPGRSFASSTTVARAQTPHGVNVPA